MSAISTIFFGLFLAFILVIFLVIIWAVLTDHDDDWRHRGDD